MSNSVHQFCPPFGEVFQCSLPVWKHDIFHRMIPYFYSTSNSQLTNDDKPALLFRSGCEYTLYHPTDASRIKVKGRKNVVLCVKEKSVLFALGLNTHAKLPFKERKSGCFWGLKQGHAGSHFPSSFSLSLSRKESIPSCLTNITNETEQLPFFLYSLSRERMQ